MSESGLLRPNCIVSREDIDISPDWSLILDIAQKPEHDVPLVLASWGSAGDLLTVTAVGTVPRRTTRPYRCDATHQVRTRFRGRQIPRGCAFLCLLTARPIDLTGYFAAPDSSHSGRGWEYSGVPDDLDRIIRKIGRSES